ncbi:enolase-phosphatase E1-like protein [Dinothrombium tinctorium]|uniref:Enolase-phosphatase E1-like protein n=1 Tax=Dinothrombium tinctorium TaxID=1965070 RepID=A0A3S3P296_9ACAR|nr:enolase-phosphatase E1-like protein [Dinothrombium tinctorium]
MAYSEQSKHFIKTYIHQYFQECFPQQKNLRLDIQFFKKQEIEDQKKQINQLCPKFPPNWNTFSKTLIPDLISFILWKIENDFSSPPVAYFTYHMTEWGYRVNLRSTPIYDDILEAFTNWKAQNISLYVAVASPCFANMVLSSTNHGNIAYFFSGHMNLTTFENYKTVKIFDRLPEMLGKEAKNILFLTRFPLDARSALHNEITSVLVLREDFDPDGKKKLEAAYKNPEQHAKLMPKTEDKSEEVRSMESTPIQSTTFDITPALEMANVEKKEAKNKEETLTTEEIGSTVMLFESTESLRNAEFEVRNSDSKIILADIRELFVIESLTDIEFQ